MSEPPADKPHTAARRGQNCFRRPASIAQKAARRHILSASSTVHFSKSNPSLSAGPYILAHPHVLASTSGRISPGFVFKRKNRHTRRLLQLDAYIIGRSRLRGHAAHPDSPLTRALTPNAHASHCSLRSRRPTDRPDNAGQPTPLGPVTDGQNDRKRGAATWV